MLSPSNSVHSEQVVKVYSAQRGILDPQTTRTDAKNSFTFTINGGDKMVDGFAIHSPPFGAGGISWRMLLKVTAADGDGKVGACLGFFTSCCSHPYSSNWKVTAKATLITLTSSKTIFQRRCTDHEYNSKSNDWGYAQFADMNDIRTNCFVDNMFRVRMEVEVIKHEGFVPYHKFINNLVGRLGTPYKRLREGFLDEAITMNNEILREAMGRHHVLVQKLQSQNVVLNDMKLKQSIERIERGGVYSPSNDRMTVKTALMGVPLPKHLSRKINMLPKNVRADLTAKIVQSSENSVVGAALSCSQKDVAACTDYYCVCSGGCQGAISRRNMSSTTSIVESSTETATTSDSGYSYEEDGETVVAHCPTDFPDEMFEGLSTFQQLHETNVGAPLPESTFKSVTVKGYASTSDISPSPSALSVTKIYSKSRDTANDCFGMPLDYEKLVGKRKDGKSGFKAISESILRKYFLNIVQDQADMTFESYVSSVNNEAVKSFERCIVGLVDFFKSATDEVCRNTNMKPPAPFVCPDGYECSLEVIKYIDECSKVIAEVVKLQVDSSDSKRSQMFTDIQNEQKNVLQSLRDRAAEMKTIRGDAMSLAAELKQQLEEVEQFEESTVTLKERHQQCLRRLNKIEHAFDYRDYERHITNALDEIIEIHKGIVDAVAAESITLKKKLSELKAALKQSTYQLQASCKEKTAASVEVSRETVSIRKEIARLEKEKIKIVQKMQLDDEQHDLEMRQLEKRKVIELYGMLDDEIEDFLDDCDNALRDHGRLYELTFDQYERLKIKAEIDMLRRYENVANALRAEVKQHEDECLALLDHGSSIDDLPDLPVVSLPTIPRFPIVC